MKLKVYLLGKHIKCTPFAYDSYRQLLERYFRVSNDILDADYIVMGLERNINDFQKELFEAITFNPRIKLLVISEEPYWDLVLSNPSADKDRLAQIGDTYFQYSVLSHSTTEIFKFEHLPYFITTNDKFIARYRELFSRNAGFAAKDIIKHFETTRYKVAMVAERRDDKKFAASCDEAGLMGLMLFRTNLMSAYQSKDALIMGKGWHTDEMRQQLPDWHLDKLARLDCKSKIISAIENTHHIDYVSEKFFDSMACLSVPIYYAQKEHSIFKLTEEKAFIKLAKRNIADATKAIDSFEVDKSFVKSYLDAQRFLNSLIGDNLILTKQRAYFAARLLDSMLNS